MNVAIIVPYRPVDEWRAAAWEKVQEQWADFDCFTVDDGGEPFSRGASINQGIAQHPADLYVLADADTLVARAQVDRALKRAAAAPGLVVAFNRFVSLTEEGTRLILEGHRGSREPFIGWTAQNTCSSCVALSHATWEASGGFDERFRGWGYSDNQFDAVCATFAGEPRRVTGTAWHLYHPPARTAPPENAAWFDEYRARCRNPEAMETYIASVKAGVA